MKAQISAGLNFAVSGIPYWTMDIGGFCVENRYVAGQMEFNKTGRENTDYKEWRELNARWYQFGAFCRCSVHTASIRTVRFGTLLRQDIRATTPSFTIRSCVTT